MATPNAETVDLDQRANSQEDLKMFNEDSPCHYCDKRPCYEHDTCEKYLEFRAIIEARRKENIKNAVMKDYVNRSIAKRLRKERYK